MKTPKQLADEFHGLMDVSEEFYQKQLDLLDQLEKAKRELDRREHQIANVLVELVNAGVLQPHEANVCRMDCMGMEEQQIANVLRTTRQRVLDIREEVKRKLNAAAADKPTV